MRHLLPKCLLATTGAVALSALGLLATSAGSPVEAITSPERGVVFAEANDELVFHGSVEQSDREDWNQIQNYGVYRFTFDSEPVAEGPLSYARTDGGGFFHDSKYYCITQAVDPSTREEYGILRTFDTYTWKQISTVETAGETLAVAYDYTQSKAYAVTAVLTDNYARLLEIDLATGNHTEVAKLGRRFPAIAFDADGQLWGISREFPFPHKTALCKINKTTGETTEVGMTGFNQKSNYAAATFDLRTGKLYWTTRTFTYDQYWQETYDTLLA